MQKFDLNEIFSEKPISIVKTDNRNIYEFAVDGNSHMATIDSFSNEWKSFHNFKDSEILKLGNEYFDIISPHILNKNTSVLEVGCGSGRFVKYMCVRAKFVVGIDPSDAIYSADTLLGHIENVLLARASANNLPFHDAYFDFVCSIGVLHHVPDTFKALQACVDKVKSGGYFFTYLYYALDNRGPFFRFVFYIVNALRMFISRLPGKMKRSVCNVLACLIYLPLIALSRALKKIGVSETIRKKIPLASYENKSFYIIRNDSLDRFGTPLEKRFTKKQITEMMEGAGLENITFSNHSPFWHAVGRKK